MIKGYIKYQSLYPQQIVDLVACSFCKAKAGQLCKGKKSLDEDSHKAREKAAFKEADRLGVTASLEAVLI